MDEDIRVVWGYPEGEPEPDEDELAAREWAEEDAYQREVYYAER